MSDTSSSLEHWLPWAKCNLCRNPFGELTPDERADVAIVDLDPIARRVAQPRSAVQLIAECGRGKTTRMLALWKSIRTASYVYLSEDGPCPAIPEGNPVLIDEAQRLPKAVLRQILKTGVPLVLATHDDLSRPLRRFDYHVHTQRIEEGNTPELIHRLLNRRIEAARLQEGPLPVLSLGQSRGLVARFGSNIREIENYLYELVQSQVIDHGEMRFID